MPEWFFFLTYPQVDLRLSPWRKLKPAKYLDKDPLTFVLPLMDAYAGSEREKYRESPILHPIPADIESLPRNMLFITRVWTSGHVPRSRLPESEAYRG
ncbi:hypothetical protein BDV38DRAFT_93208 [Aspergillus pseudotamarii]|uniref:Uncharacterized protein n=1 Tax=Aspergillus pseudotamarii TaxID=132259 RepID=A0A5N6T912_ASPPS|nr:uncharacterized protein BDV38DRAFT_93208 [Aspergillus pseudotamarii]KAE8142770.1 hypothetical protein BDV38DRAFT_93208 [Aspergillus pseudotamarii]